MEYSTVKKFLGNVYWLVMSEFFLLNTDIVRTPSGLLLPNTKGEALAVIGTLATDQLRDKAQEAGAELAPHQAIVIVDVNLFLHAAADIVRARQEGNHK